MVPSALRSHPIRILIPIALAMTVAVFLLAFWMRPVPRIRVEPPTQDLGEMPQQHLELAYTVRNEGKSALHIEDVTTTCGCTKATVEEAIIPPGGSTQLRVTMDPQNDNLYGNLFRVITVRSNDPATPEAKVDFRVSIPRP